MLLSYLLSVIIVLDYSAGMEFPLVVINAVIRSRNRSSYFQACIVLLLVVVLVTVLIISTTPVSVTERIGNERIAVSRTIEG